MGALVHSDTSTPLGGLGNATDITIGANDGGPSPSYHGALDELAIYDYALSEERIRAHFPEPGMLALLAFGGLPLIMRPRGKRQR